MEVTPGSLASQVQRAAEAVLCDVGAEFLQEVKAAVKGKPSYRGDPRALERPRPWNVCLQRNTTHVEWKQPKREAMCTPGSRAGVQ